MTVREVAVNAYREALPVLSVSALGGLFAGLVLGGMSAELQRIQGLLVLVPALLATRGNVYGSLGARLGSALHQGLIEFSLGGLGWIESSVSLEVCEGIVGRVERLESPPTRSARGASLSFKRPRVARSFVMWQKRSAFLLQAGPSVSQ